MVKLPHEQCPILLSVSQFRFERPVAPTALKSEIQVPASILTLRMNSWNDRSIVALTTPVADVRHEVMLNGDVRCEINERNLIGLPVKASSEIAVLDAQTPRFETMFGIYELVPTSQIQALQANVQLLPQAQEQPTLSFRALSVKDEVVTLAGDIKVEAQAKPQYAVVFTPKPELVAKAQVEKFYIF